MAREFEEVAHGEEGEEKAELKEAASNVLASRVNA
jgi:hypothetical protein